MSYPSASIQTHTTKSSNPWLADDARFLYLLDLTELGSESLLAHYECNHAFVVIARDSKTARKLAQARIADEKHVHAEFWLRPHLTTCTKIGLARKSNGKSPAKERVVVTEDSFR